LATEATAEDLAQALGDIREEVTIKGRVRVITPLRTKQFFDVLKCVYRLKEAGAVELNLGEGADVAQAVAQLRREFDALKMVMCGGDQIIRIVAIGSGLSVSEVEGLNPVDMLKATTAVFKVNLDFFDQNADELKESLAPLWDMIKGQEVGAAPSPDSSTTDTE